MTIKTAGKYRTFRFAAMSLSLVMAGAASANDVSRPDVISFGASAADMAAILDPYCQGQTIEPVEPVQIPGASSQSQLECEGFEYFGAPRRAEFIFADDVLTIVWILTSKSEEPALVAAFKAAFGEPSHETPSFTAFAGSRAAVRKDVPEVLYYSQSVAAAYDAWFDQQAED